MRRKNKTNQLRTIARKLPVVFATVAFIYLALLIKDIEIPVIMPVQNVQVEGELIFLNKKEIHITVTENLMGGYFSVNLKQIREILLQEPWIKDVSLRRKWPASVSVNVEEHKPLAYWNRDAYIGESGEVFKPSEIDTQLKLPQLNGPETQHDNVLKFMNVLYKQMIALDYHVRRLDLDDRRAWQLVIEKQVASGDEVIDDESMNNDIVVKLGRYDTEKRLLRFIRVLPALTAEIEMSENRIKVVDIRYPNGFAVEMVEKMADQKKIANEIQNNKNTDMNDITRGFVYAHRYATVSMSGA